MTPNINQNTVNVTLAAPTGVGQRPFILRAIYFLLIGWWLTAFWVTLAYLFALLVLTLPIATWMFDRTNAVLTLARR